MSDEREVQNDSLTELECEVICLACGVDCKQYNDKAIAGILRTSIQRIQDAKEKAIEILRRSQS
jgi:DNA-directed RNA polymerase sigma subunit (sigma70/sigma32)